MRFPLAPPFRKDNTAIINLLWEPCVVGSSPTVWSKIGYGAIGSATYKNCLVNIAGSSSG